MGSFCSSCGMPMKNKEDHALSDETKDYCKYCADENGNLRSYDEVLENWSNFIVKSEDISKEEAVRQVKKQMEKLSAWKSK